MPCSLLSAAWCGNTWRYMHCCSNGCLSTSRSAARISSPPCSEAIRLSWENRCSISAHICWITHKNHLLSNVLNLHRCVCACRPKKNQSCSLTCTRRHRSIAPQTLMATSRSGPHRLTIRVDSAALSASEVASCQSLSAAYHPSHWPLHTC